MRKPGNVLQVDGRQYLYFALLHLCCSRLHNQSHPTCEQACDDCLCNLSHHQCIDKNLLCYHLGCGWLSAPGENNMLSPQSVRTLVPSAAVEALWVCSSKSGNQIFGTKHCDYFKMLRSASYCVSLLTFSSFGKHINSVVKSH